MTTVDAFLTNCRLASSGSRPPPETGGRYVPSPHRAGDFFGVTADRMAKLELARRSV